MNPVPIVGVAGVEFRALSELLKPLTQLSTKTSEMPMSTVACAGVPARVHVVATAVAAVPVPLMPRTEAESLSGPPVAPPLPRM